MAIVFIVEQELSEGDVEAQQRAHRFNAHRLANRWKEWEAIPFSQYVQCKTKVQFICLTVQ